MNYSPFNNIGSATHGRGSGGAMNNPMYRKVCVQGHYEPLRSRPKRRILAKSEGISLGKTKYFWEFWSMNVKSVNKKVIECLRELSDDKGLSIEQNKHIKVTGTFRGQKRSLVLFCSPSSCYQTYLRSTLRRFLRSLELDQDLRPIFWGAGRLKVILLWVTLTLPNLNFFKGRTCAPFSSLICC